MFRHGKKGTSSGRSAKRFKFVRKCSPTKPEPNPVIKVDVLQTSAEHID